MAHNIARSRDGKAIFAGVGQRAWHGLGTILEQPATATELVKAAGGDYKVAKVLATSTARLADGTPVIVGAHEDDAKAFLVVNEDTGRCIAPGGVGAGYTTVQNLDWAAALDQVTSGQAVWDTFGALGLGQEVFFCSLPLGAGEAVKGDEINRRLLCGADHAGQKGGVMTTTDIRVVCANTYGWALSRAKHKIKFRHTKNIQASIDAAVGMLAEANKTFAGGLEKLAWLAQQPAGEAEIQQLATIIAPRMVKRDDQGRAYLELSSEASKTKALVCDLFDGQARGSQYGKGTRYALWNVYTEYVSHHRSIKGSSDETERASMRSVAAFTDEGLAKGRQQVFDALMSPEGLKSLATKAEPKLFKTS